MSLCISAAIMPQTTRAERLAHLKAYLLKDVPAAKQFCKDRSLSDYLNQEQDTASFPEELRKLLRNKFFEKEVAALQSCIAAGAVVRADLEVRGAILHLFSAEEGAEGTRTSVADRQLRGNMVPSPPLAKESQEECVNCKALAEQLAAAREKNKNLEAELAGLRRPAKRTIDQVVASSSADCDVGDDEHMPGQPAEKKCPSDGPHSAVESLRLARGMPIFAECG